MTQREALRRKAIEYPVSDGEPMGETDAHRRETVDAIEVLDDHFAGDPLVYVSGNNFIYFTEGRKNDVVSPDCYVVRGVEKRLRDVYMLWEEGGRVPCFVLEVTSRKTHRTDRGKKLRIYQQLGVAEYFLFDPRGEWIPERLRGYRLRRGAAEPAPPAKPRPRDLGRRGPASPQRATEGGWAPLAFDAAGRLASRALGLELGVVAGHLRFSVPGGPASLPTRAERARAEAERARAAEAEVARLRAELDRLRAGGRDSAP